MTHGILSMNPPDEDGRRAFFLLIKNDGPVQVRPSGEGIITLPALYDLANDNHLSHLWIHPSCGIEINTPLGDEMKDFDWLPNWKFDQSVADRLGQNTLISFYGRRQFRPYESTIHPTATGLRRSYNLYIIFLEHVLWDWPKYMAPAQLLGLIHELEGKLTVQISGSPSGVGMRYLRRIEARHENWFVAPQANLQDIPFAEGAKPLIWRRLPDLWELTEATHLVAFDKNAAFPRAAVEEIFGVGEPFRTNGTNAYIERGLHEKLPGIWHIAECIPPAENGAWKMLPPPIWKGAEWLATPLVKLLYKMGGYNIKYDYGWVFPKSAHVYARWAKNLWEFRQEYEPGSPQRESFKQIMNDTLGLTRSLRVAGSGKFRPDHNTQIVAGARAAMLYNLIKYAQNGYYPIMVQIDAIYYLSRTGDPERAVPGMLSHSQSLGGYKHKWSLPLTDQVKALLLAPKLAQTKILQQLNDLAEEQDAIPTGNH